MAIFKLNSNFLGFPPCELAESSGLLAIGGKLNTEWLLEAYSVGVFPWFNENEPLMWWSPDPRSVAKPGGILISKSMKPYFKKNIFNLRIDTNFAGVIDACQKIPRKGQDGTWITKEMKDAYIDLFEMGYAHSFETYKDERLIGGLYGVSLGKMFFGESMFSLESNASKFAFIGLSLVLQKKDFTLIDCQVPNSHLESMGCFNMRKEEYLKILQKNNFEKTIRGNWSSGIMNFNTLF